MEVGGQGVGTGFLIGPDMVLTNWHVIEQAKKIDKLDSLGCRFDYLQLPDGTQQAGQLIPLRADACVDFSVYSIAETTNNPEYPPPTQEELDYALLRLGTVVGQQSIEGSVRGWIALPNAPMPLPAEAPLLIVQHPEGAPMKLALDTQAVIGRNDNGTRLRYKTNTDPGSSGSPCFTMDWNLVALHHYGDPKWREPLFNQGVPMELIRNRIMARGFGNAFGG